MDVRLDLRRELGRLLFGLCCALGGLAGLWWTIVTLPPGQEPAAALRAIAAHFGAGFGAGIVLGLLLATALRRRG